MANSKSISKLLLKAREIPSKVTLTGKTSPASSTLITYPSAPNSTGFSSEFLKRRVSATSENPTPNDSLQKMVPRIVVI